MLEYEIPKLKKNEETQEFRKYKYPNLSGIPDNMKSQFENLSGFSLDDVRVHYDSDKPEQMDALAYTQANQIYIESGQNQCLPHEIGHVIQQKQGKVNETKYFGTAKINDNEALEKEADNISEKAARMQETYEYMQMSEDANEFLFNRNYDINTAVHADSNNVVQLWQAGRRYVKSYASERDVSLTDEAADILSEVINSIEDRGYLSRPSLVSLDSYLNQMREYKEHATPDELREYMLQGAIAIQNFKNSENIDLASTHYLSKNEEGEVTENPNGQGNQFTGIEFIRMLDGYQKAELYAQIAFVKPYCEDKGIQKLIQGAAVNVKKEHSLMQAAGGQAAQERGKKLFINRVKLMADYIKNVGEQTVRNGEDQDVKIKDIFFIESTGSDPHQGGQHALYLINRVDDSQKQLYKPHSLALEKAFMDTGGFLDNMNNSIEKESDRFALLPIRLEEHTENFAKRVGDYANPLKNKADVKTHFRKLGMLEAAASLMGITDLHAENVIFTSIGPIAIDAECGGYSGSTGISGVSQLSETSRGEFTNASALYLESDGVVKRVNRTDYNEDYRSGMQEMMSIMLKNKNIIIEKYKVSMSSVDRFRIVPIDTSQLSGILELYVKGEKNAEELAMLYLDGNESIQNLLNKVSFDFNVPGFVELDIDEYKKCFSDAIKAGTLPAFEVQMKDTIKTRAGAILLDGKTIGQIMVKDGNEVSHSISQDELLNSFSAKAERRMNLLCVKMYLAEISKQYEEPIGLLDATANDIIKILENNKESLREKHEKIAGEIKPFKQIWSNGSKFQKLIPFRIAAELLRKIIK